MGAKPGILERMARGPVLLDGGLGSLFIAEGLAAGQAPERWVVEQPQRVLAAHRAYAEAGAEVLHAVTFGGNRPKLRTAGLEPHFEAVNRDAVALCREAAGGSALVAGDLGPTGELFPPMGTAEAEALEAAFAEQAALLAEAGVDLFHLETMYDLREALAALRGALRTGLPVLASMTFERRKRGFFTLLGDRVEPSLDALAEAGAAAVGFNCSVQSRDMLDLVRLAREAVSCPLVAQPNAGQPRVTTEGVVYDEDWERFAADLLQMTREGATLVGGCCGTDPDFIRSVRALLDR